MPQEERSPWQGRPEERGLPRYRLAVVEAYFGIAGWAKDGRPNPPICFYLSGEATVPATENQAERKLDWTENWRVEIGNTVTFQLATPGDRADAITNGKSGFDGYPTERSDYMLFAATAAGFALKDTPTRGVVTPGASPAVPFNDRGMVPLSSNGWAGLIIDIESKVTRVYTDKTSPTGELKEARVPLCIGFVGVVGGAVAPMTGTVTPMGTMANGSSNGAEGTISDDDLFALLLPLAQVYGKANYPGYLEKAMKELVARGVRPNVSQVTALDARVFALVQ